MWALGRALMWLGLLLCVGAVAVSAQDALTPTPSAFYMPPTATFAPVSDAVLSGSAYARLVPETYAPLTGQPFTMRLEARVPSDMVLLDWFDLPPQWGGFEVLSIGPRTETTLPDGDRLYAQTLTVVVWQPGDVRLPEAAMGYGFSRESRLTVPLRADNINVPTVVDFSDPTLRPLRGALFVPLFPWGWVALAGVGLLLGGYAGLRWWRSRRVVAESAPPAPEAVALAALESLRGAEAGPALLGAVAVVLRQYVAARYSVPAQGMTAAELWTVLVPQLTPDSLAVLDELLTAADAARYAGQPVTRDQASQALDSAAAWVRADAQSALPLPEEVPG